MAPILEVSRGQISTEESESEDGRPISTPLTVLPATEIKAGEYKSEDDHKPEKEISGCAEAQAQDRKYNTLDAKRILFVTYVVVGICQGCFFIYISLLPYLVKTYGLSPVKLGYLQSSAALIQLALSPIIGRYGDKYGARAVLILSALSSASGQLTMGLATCVPMIMASRLFTVAQDIRLGAQMMVSDLVPGKERGVAMAKLALPMSLGMFIGPALGGQLAKYLGEQNSLLLTWIGPMVCVLILTTFVPKNTKIISSNMPVKGEQKEKKPFLTLLRQRNILVLVTIKLLTAVPFMTFAQSIGVIGMTVFNLSPQMNGMVLSYNGVLGIVMSAFVLGALGKKFSEDQLLRAAPFLMLIAYGLLTQLTNVWMLLVVLIPWNLGSAILDNQVIVRLTKSVPPSETGSMVGVNAALFQFSRIVAPLLGGVLIQKLGVASIGVLGSSLSVLLATVVYASI